MGRTLEEALEITDQVVADALDRLPEEKMHCSNHAPGAIVAAINEYRKVHLSDKMA